MMARVARHRAVRRAPPGEGAAGGSRPSDRLRLPSGPVPGRFRAAIPAAARAVALAVVLALPVTVQAQSVGTPDDPPLPGEAGDPGDGRIDGFWGFEWGADSARIVARMGPPLSVSDLGGGVRTFAFTPLFLGRDGYLFLRLTDGSGLVGGTWEPMTSDCTDMLRRLVRTLKRAHPRVPVRTRGDLGGGLGRDLCTAAMEDGARLEVRWEDEPGNRLRVLSTPDQPALRMVGIAAGRDDGHEEERDGRSGG